MKKNEKKKELNSYYCSYLIDYIKRNNKAIVFSIFLLVITYFIKLFMFTISIDTEVTMNDVTSNNLPWIATGRWALTYIGKVVHLFGRFNPFFSNMLMILFFVGAIVLLGSLISNIDNNESNEKKFLLILSSLVLTSPIIAEMLNFTMMTAEVGIGIFITTLSTIFTYVFISRKCKKSFLLAVMLLTIAMGIYQGLYPIYITEIVFIFIYSNIKNNTLNMKEKLLHICKIMGVFIVSFVMCELVSKVLMWHFNLNKSGYLTDQILWNKNPILTNIARIKNIIFGIINPGIDNVVYNYGLLVSIVICITIGICLFIKNKKEYSLEILSLIAFFMSPFFIIILTANNVAIRTLMNLPFLVALSFILLCEMCKNKRILYMSFIAIFIITMFQIKGSNDLFYAVYSTYEEDKSTINNVMNKIDMMDGLVNDNREETTIIFIGMKSTKSTTLISRGDTMGYSFFEWDPATEYKSNRRIKGLAQTQGIFYLLPTPEQIEEAEEYANKKMDIYPSKNSIVIRNDCVIVRMS